MLPYQLFSKTVKRIIVTLYGIGYEDKLKSYRQMMTAEREHAAAHIRLAALEPTTRQALWRHRLAANAFNRAKAWEKKLIQAGEQA